MNVGLCGEGVKIRNLAKIVGRRPLSRWSRHVILIGILVNPELQGSGCTMRVGTMAAEAV
jgi:hypothetical protein